MWDTLICLMALTGATMGHAIAKRSGLRGFDVSSYEESVDFKGAQEAGVRFVIAKATEGTSYIDRVYHSHIDKATSAGLYRGAYHFAHPDRTSGAEQAQYFLAHGGKWANDGKTLPGMLDIEYNPSGSTCYGMSTSAMTAWVASFVNAYHSSTGRYPMIYTTQDWWSTCTGDAEDFADKCPLVLARYGSSPGKLPGGWKSHTIWQSSDKFTFGGDADIFNGSEEDLKKLASNGGGNSTSPPTTVSASSTYSQSTPSPLSGSYPTSYPAPAPTFNSTSASDPYPTASSTLPSSSVSPPPMPYPTLNSTIVPTNSSTSNSTAPPCHTATSTFSTSSYSVSLPASYPTVAPYPTSAYPSEPSWTAYPEESLSESIAKLRRRSHLVRSSRWA